MRVDREEMSFVDDFYENLNWIVSKKVISFNGIQTRSFWKKITPCIIAPSDKAANIMTQSKLEVDPRPLETFTCFVVYLLMTK